MIILLGIVMVLFCALIQSATVSATLSTTHAFLTKKRIKASHRHLPVFEILVYSSVLTILFFGLLTQAFIWSLVFVLTGEITDIHRAFYFSLVNFTTLGYGDIVLSDDYAVLGPLEASNGILMLGLSTSLLYTVGQTLRKRSKRYTLDDDL